MFAKIIAFFKKLFGFVTLHQPPSTYIPYVKPEPDSDIAEEEEHVVSDEEALETLESTEEELPKGIRLIDGVKHFWSGLQGWTPVPEIYPGKELDPFLANMGLRPDINYFGFKPFPGADQWMYDRMQMKEEGFDITGYKSNSTEMERSQYLAQHQLWLDSHGGERPIVDPYVFPDKE